MFKDECKSTMDDAEHIQGLIEEFREKCAEGRRENMKRIDMLAKLLTRLEEYVHPL